MVYVIMFALENRYYSELFANMVAMALVERDISIKLCQTKRRFLLELLHPIPATTKWNKC